MPVWKRKELRKELGFSSAHISTYIKRGKLIPSDSKGTLFDTSVPENAEVIEARQKKIQETESETETQANEEIGQEPPDEINEETVSEEIPETPGSEVQELSEMNGYTLDPPRKKTKGKIEAWKKFLEAWQVKEKVEVLQLQKQKILGENLPADAVEMVISQMVKNYLEAFKDAVENLAIEYASTNKLSNEQIAEMRESLINEINSQAQNAVDTSKKEIKNLKKNVSEKRNKGESKTGVRHDTNK